LHSLQSKTRSSLQEQELKDSLQRVQDEAQKQLEVVNGQLQSRSGELKEKERELGEMRLKLEGEVASLQQQLLVRGEELQAARSNITEVPTHLHVHVHVVYL
jgi:predicted  nucleic acid-binding Zn-ribbon protein